MLEIDRCIYPHTNTLEESKRNEFIWLMWMNNEQKKKFILLVLILKSTMQTITFTHLIKFSEMYATQLWIVCRSNFLCKHWTNFVFLNQVYAKLADSMARKKNHSTSSTCISLINETSSNDPCHTYNIYLVIHWISFDSVTKTACVFFLLVLLFAVWKWMHISIFPYNIGAYYVYMCVCLMEKL